MDPNFYDVADDIQNEIFKVVFFPDRIYHDAYFNATVSQRYRYNVTEVRNKHDITILKAQVFQDGQFLANVLRVEYLATRLSETVREQGRFLEMGVSCNITLNLPDGTTVSSNVNLGYCGWVRAYQCELWDNLDPISGSSHQFKVVSQMGKNGSITRVPQFDAAFKTIKEIKEISINFTEGQIDEPFGYIISSIERTQTADDDYFRSYQVPKTQDPSSPQNTVQVNSYLVNFRRGWFLDATKIDPVRYENAMMENINPDFRPSQPIDNQNNIVEMRWIIQRELGSNLVYFHHVTVKPNSFEGIHQHIGSEELYYIVSGEGTAYMGDGDDPDNDQYPLVKMEVFCVGQKPVRQLTVKPGNVIYTKSGGIHGIRNESLTEDLTFVAFGYQCA